MKRKITSTALLLAFLFLNDMLMNAQSNILVNNNAGASNTLGFTQSTTSILAFGNHVLIGFNDAGSYPTSNSKFTGFAYSSDGGATFTDGGALPFSSQGDAGEPALARDTTTGRIYFATLQFTENGINVSRSA